MPAPHEEDINAAIFQAVNTEPGQVLMDRILNLVKDHVPVHTRAVLLREIGELGRMCYTGGFDAGVVHQLTTIEEKQP